MGDNRNMDVLMAFGIGALVGAVGALLLAPASGEETRKRLGEFAHDATEKARQGVDRASTYVKDQAERAGGIVKDQKERLAHAVEEGKQAYRGEVSKT